MSKDGTSYDVAYALHVTLKAGARKHKHAPVLSCHVTSPYLTTR